LTLPAPGIIGSCPENDFIIRTFWYMDDADAG
jgi:hypothetical protein